MQQQVLNTTKRFDVSNLVGKSMRMQLEAAAVEKLPKLLQRDLHLVDAIEGDLHRLSTAFDEVLNQATAKPLHTPLPPRKLKPEKDIFAILRNNTAMSLNGITKAVESAFPHEPRVNAVVKRCLKSLLNAKAILREGGLYKLVSKKAISKCRMRKQHISKRLRAPKRSEVAPSPVDDAVSGLEEALERCRVMVSTYEEVVPTPEEAAMKGRGDRACMRMLAVQQKLQEMSNRLDGWNDRDCMRSTQEAGPGAVLVETVTGCEKQQPNPTLLETVTMSKSEPVGPALDRAEKAKTRMESTKKKLVGYQVPLKLSQTMRADNAKSRMELAKHSLGRGLLNPRVLDVSNVA